MFFAIYLSQLFHLSVISGIINGQLVFDFFLFLKNKEEQSIISTLILDWYFI